MTFSVHTFETNPEGNRGFAFHKNVGEGISVYFLSKFSQDTKNPQEAAETIFGAVVDYLESSKLTDNYDKFEESLKVTNQAAKKIIGSNTERPDIVIAFFDFHNLYLTQCGKAEAYMIRDGGVSQITEAPENHEDLFLNILSGQVSVDDVVLLSSDRILRTLTANELTEIFARPNFQDATNVFRHELGQKSEEDLLVSVIGIGKKESAPAAGFLSKVMNAHPIKTVKEKTNRTPKNNSEPLVQETEEPKEKTDKKTTGKALDIQNIISKIVRFRPERNLVILALVVLSLFGLGLGIKSINWGSEEEIKLREEIDIAREALQQSDTFLVQGDRAEAKITLEKANQAVQNVFKSKSKLFRSDAQFLLADIKSKQLQVENARQVTPNLVADLTVKSDNPDVRGLLDMNGTFFVYNGKQVIKTVRNIVESPLVLSDSGGSVIAAGSRADQKTIIFMTDDPRVVEYREGILNPMQTEDENWKKGLDLKTYGRFMYLLSPTDNQIWKYERRRSNYSASTAYNTGADLSESVSFAIDGNIYVLGAGGTIQKIFRGNKEEYDFRDLPSIAFTGPNLKIFTSAELDYLYVLDPDNQRLLMFTKGDRFATYKRQILYGLDDVRDFVVDENGQRVSLVTGEKVYEFSL